MTQNTQSVQGENEQIDRIFKITRELKTHIQEHCTVHNRVAGCGYCFGDQQ